MKEVVAAGAVAAFNSNIELLQKNMWWKGCEIE